MSAEPRKNLMVTENCINCGDETLGLYCANCTAYARQEGHLPVIDTYGLGEARDNRGNWLFNFGRNRSRAR